MPRVVVTGVGAYSPVGNDWNEIEANLRSLKNGIRYIEDWDVYEGLNTRLGAQCHFEPPASFIRKRTRSMGRVSFLATGASEKALSDAGLLGDQFSNQGAWVFLMVLQQGVRMQ